MILSFFFILLLATLALSVFFRGAVRPECGSITTAEICLVGGLVLAVPGFAALGVMVAPAGVLDLEAAARFGLVGSHAALLAIASVTYTLFAIGALVLGRFSARAA